MRLVFLKKINFFSPHFPKFLIKFFCFQEEDEEENVRNIHLKIYSSLLKKIGSSYSGIIEIRDRTLSFENFIVDSIKVVPGNYYAAASEFIDSGVTPEITMSVNGVDFLSAMELSSAGISDLWNSIQKIRFCVAKDDRNLMDNLIENFTYSKARFMSIIEEVVSDKTPKGLYENLLNVELECQLITDYMRDMKNKLEEIVVKYRKKGKLIRILLEDGIEYLGDSSLDKYLRDDDTNVFMLFISEGYDPKSIFSNINYLYKLMNDFPKRSIFLIIDLDVSTVAGKIKIPDNSVIYHYKNALVSEDVQTDLAKKTDEGFVYFNFLNPNKGQPEKRCVLTIKCPGSFSKICSGKAIDWKCGKCKKLIEYDFGGKLYCDCGNYNVEKSKFKCTDYRHSEPVAFRDLNNFDDMVSDLTPIEEINILLIGQSGVGKSTWINGIVNYLTFSSLDEAEKNDLIAVVPTQFTICTDDHETHNISVGEDENEMQKIGASATQACKTYAVVTRTRAIRLIDTPGIGDTRGYEQDSENIVKIIQHIQNIKELHGICFLLKPNEARLEACFTFCLKELFSFLPKKARSNIFFCFTNSRSTNYKPGNSLPLIRKILEEANSQIRIFEDTVSCFDNESFRFLCAIKDGIKFSDDEKKSYADSWRRSVKETNKLISKVSELEPYDVSQTKTIADLRHKISVVLDAIHDISRNSETATIKSLESQRTDYSKKISDLTNSKNVQKTVLKNVAITGDIVCTNPNCTEKFDNQTIYKTRCCQGCTHSGSNKYETLPNADLLRCPILARQTCSVCNCRWEQHMLTQFKQEKETSTERDEKVQEEIDKTRRLQASLQLQLVKARKEVEAEEAEKQAYISFAALVFRYLKRDTLVLYNDSLKDYLDYLITSEESKPDKTKIEKAKIKKLNELKNKHEEESKIAEGVKKEFILKDDTKVSLKDIINEEVISLESLRHYVKKPNKYEGKLVHSQKVIRCLV